MKRLDHFVLDIFEEDNYDLTWVTIPSNPYNQLLETVM